MAGKYPKQPTSIAPTFSVTDIFLPITLSFQY